MRTVQRKININQSNPYLHRRANDLNHHGSQQIIERIEPIGNGKRSAGHGFDVQNVPRRRIVDDGDKDFDEHFQVGGRMLGIVKQYSTAQWQYFMGR